VEIPFATPNAAFGYLVEHWHQELELIEGAPVLMVATLAISLTLGCLISRFVYQSTISGLREHVGVLEANVAFLKDEFKYAKKPRNRS
jgi:hypothetical protein